jgi:hypothetical protein
MNLNDNKNVINLFYFVGLDEHLMLLNKIKLLDNIMQVLRYFCIRFW